MNWAQRLIPLRPFIILSLHVLPILLTFAYSLLLVLIYSSILVGNVPFAEGYKIGIYEQGSVLNILYSGVINGWYPPLIFLGIGAMTDFSTLIANPKLLLIGAAAHREHIAILDSTVRHAHMSED